MSRSRGAPLRRGALVVVLVSASVAGYAGSTGVVVVAAGDDAADRDAAPLYPAGAPGPAGRTGPPPATAA